MWSAGRLAGWVRSTRGCWACWCSRAGGTSCRAVQRNSRLVRPSAATDESRPPGPTRPHGLEPRAPDYGLARRGHRAGMGSGRRGGRRCRWSGTGQLACVEPSRPCPADGGTPGGAAGPSAGHRRTVRGAAGRAVGGLYRRRDRRSVAGALAAMAVGAPRPQAGRARDPGRPERPSRGRARQVVRRPSRGRRGRRVHPRRRRARRHRLGARHRPRDLSARGGRQLLDHHGRDGRRGAPAGADEPGRPP